MRGVLKYTAVAGVLLAFPAWTNAADIEKGKARFATLCATCHGASGAGDGPVAAAMPADQKPADLAKGEMKFAVDQVKFAELLKKGGAAVGLSPMMPPQAGLSEADVGDLYAFVQSLHGK
ncbi:MAG: cytochrome c [Deltaproteobacteria bacterium]|nr:cytochrome c [Deltaproteobacteria bacterium]